MKVIIHGRPQGQDKWSSDGKFSPEEEMYVRSFLEKNSKIENKTDALIISIESQKYYYTYIRKKGIAEVERSDSYFAITLILDKRCTNVNSLIDLLENVYESYVVGKIIKDNRYVIPQFKSRESDLSSISQCIIEQYTKHLQPISALSDKEQIKDSDKAYVEYHFNDIDCPAFVEDYKHRIIVSAEYQTKNAHIEQLRKQLSSKEEECKNKYQEKINSIQAKCDKDIKAEKERCKSQTANLEKQVSQLQSQLSTIEKECQNKYKQQISSIQAKCATEIKAEKERCESKNAELKRKVSQLERDKANLDKNRQELEERLSTIADAINGIGNTRSNEYSQPTKSHPLEKWLPWFNTLLLIIIVGLFFLSKPIESSQVDEQQQTVTTEPHESEIPTIEIKGSGFFDILEVGKDYELSYSDEKDGGKFVCDDKGTINNNILKPLKKGTITISYEVDGVEVTSREFIVKN